MTLNFKKWFEWGSDEEIHGEYWIIDGFVDFADGDVGDRNHEMIAIDYVVGQYADEVADLADELGIEAEVEHYGEVDYEGFEKALWAIREKLEDQLGSEDAADKYIMQHLQCDQDTYLVLCGGGDARLYAMQKMGWIAVRLNNVELYGYSQQRQKEISDSIFEILEQEGKTPQPSDVELTIYDHKSKRSWYVTLEDLSQPEVTNRPAQLLQTKRQVVNPQDTIENMPTTDTTKRGKINPWNLAWRQAGFGSELWRGTSESFGQK